MTEVKDNLGNEENDSVVLLFYSSKCSFFDTLPDN